MIGAILSTLGKALVGPLVDLAGKYLQTQTDQVKIRSEVQMTNIRASTETALGSLNAEVQLTNQRPLLTRIMQTILQGVAIFYILMLVVVSVSPWDSWVVHALPGYWELLILLILAGLAGPQVLTALSNRFTR